MNTALWICDEFMLHVSKELDWYLFDPSECPDLHETYGSKFSKLYKHYKKMADEGEIKNFAKKFFGHFSMIFTVLTIFSLIYTEKKSLVNNLAKCSQTPIFFFFSTV